MLQKIIDVIFALSLFINSALFLPQAYKIFKENSSQGVSITTFSGFCLMQISAIIYGIFHNDRIISYGYFISFCSCFLVVILSIRYRNKK